jgi:hypothetical protein
MRASCEHTVSIQEPRVHQLFLSQPTERLDRNSVIAYFLSLRSDDVQRVRAAARPRFEKFRRLLLCVTALGALSLALSVFAVSFSAVNAARRAAEMGLPNPNVGIERFVAPMLALLVVVMCAWQLCCVQRNIDVIDTASEAAEKANASRASTSVTCP